MAEFVILAGNCDYHQRYSLALLLWPRAWQAEVESGAGAESTQSHLQHTIYGFMFILILYVYIYVYVHMYVLPQFYISDNIIHCFQNCWFFWIMCPRKCHLSAGQKGVGAKQFVTHLHNSGLVMSFIWFLQLCIKVTFKHWDFLIRG